MQERGPRNDEEVQQVARNLFLGVAPERSQELEELWHRYKPRFNFIEEISPDGAFVMCAGAYREVCFDLRSTRAFWLAAFIAWEGYRSINESMGCNMLRFREMLDCFNKMRYADDLLIVALPKGVPEPGVYEDGALPEKVRVAVELANIAIGWALLHEVRHIKHQQDGTSAAGNASSVERRAEELSCDEFATRFILDQVEAYARSANVPVLAVKLKREIGIYFGAFALTLIAKDCWGESDTHPAVQTRIDAIVQQIGNHSTRMSDAIAHAAHAALWSIWPDAPGPFKPVPKNV